MKWLYSVALAAMALAVIVIFIRDMPPDEPLFPPGKKVSDQAVEPLPVDKARPEDGKDAPSSRSTVAEKPGDSPTQVGGETQPRAFGLGKPNTVQASQPTGISGANSPEEEGPPGLKEYKGRVIAQTMHWQGAPWLQRASRIQEEQPGMMRDQLGLKPGMTVCDMGCGDGYHTLWMAEAVGKEGRVYAVDIQPEMLEMLKRNAAAKGFENIERVLGKLWDPLLPENSQDLILLVDVYHEFSHPEHMLKAMRKALKKDGLMVLVEFRTEDPKVPIKPEHKMSKEQILKEIPPMGFELAKSYDELPWQHMMFFKKSAE